MFMIRISQTIPNLANFSFFVNDKRSTVRQFVAASFKTLEQSEGFIEKHVATMDHMCFVYIVFENAKQFEAFKLVSKFNDLISILKRDHDEGVIFTYEEINMIPEDQVPPAMKVTKSKFKK